MILRKLSLLILVAAFCCFVRTAQADSLCKKDEISYFSCKVNNSEKMISLCGRYPPNLFDSDDPDVLASKEAFLMYRFGTKQNVELQYPQNKKDSLKKFEGVWIGSHFGSIREVYFRSGAYAYGVFANEGEGEKVSYGVNIFGNDTVDASPLKTFSCQKGTTTHSLSDIVNILMNFGGIVVRHPANIYH